MSNDKITEVKLSPSSSEEPSQDPSPFSEEEKYKMQLELQRHFNKFKKKMKTKAKSELVAIIWEQGMEFKKLQDIAQELFEENKSLKETKNEKSPEDNS